MAKGKEKSKEKAMTSGRAKKEIKSYIGQFGTLYTLGIWISALAAIALGAFGIYFARNTAHFNSTYSKKDSRAFIDAVAVSDWVYKYQEGGEMTAYYTAPDTEGYLYIVSMDEDQFEKLSVQNERWNASDTDSPAVVHRLYGTVHELVPLVVTELTDVWHSSSEEEFVRYFGDKYLVVEDASSVGYALPMLLAGSFFGLVFLGLLLAALPTVTRSRRYIGALRAKGLLEQAATQLNSEDGSAEDLGGCVASRDFLFGLGTGVVLPYTDILWFFQSGRGGGKNASRKLIVNTADRQNITAARLAPATADQVTQRVTSKILSRNPNALYGPGREMYTLYKELCSKRRKES